MEVNKENIFEGRWELISSEFYTDKGEWERVEKFNDGEYLWLFSPAERVEIEGMVHFEGWFREVSTGLADSHKSRYYLDIEGGNHLLTIETSKEGFLDRYEEERYSIEGVTEGANGQESLYLSLTNEADHPAPCFRLLIRRQNKTA